jgi:hypothetical protein
MKKLIATIALATLAFSASAQVDKKIIKIDNVCYPTVWIVDQITSQFGEQLIYSMSSDKKVSTHLYVNKQKNTYTIIFTPGDGEYSCVLDAGKNVRVPPTVNYNSKGTI